jgi:hypothetical protein
MAKDARQTTSALLRIVFAPMRVPPEHSRQPATYEAMHGTIET